MSTVRDRIPTATPRAAAGDAKGRPRATFEGTTVDRHVAAIPYVGQAIRVLRQPLIQNTLMDGAPPLLVLGMLAAIRGKPKENTATADAGADHAATLS